MLGKPFLIALTVALLSGGVPAAMTVLGTRAPGTPLAVATASATPGTTVIDAMVGETFTPAPAAANRRTDLLTPTAALSRHTQGKTTRLLPGVHVQLGYLTLPGGQIAPNHTNHELVYAFTAHSCGPQIQGRFSPPSPTPTPDPAQCMEWMFLDAVTGYMVDGTWTH